MPKAVYANDPQTQKSLQHSLKDAGAYAVMIGIGETYLSAFAVFLKASTPQMGVLASLPSLLASLVQLFSAWLGRWTGQRKRIILTGVMIQALAWLPLMILPIMFPDYAVPLLIACVVLYHCGANLAAPQWSSLMGDIVPERRRGRFFARRTAIVSIVTFAALTVGGLTLHILAAREATLQGFIILFSIAMLARLTTFYQLSKMHDPSGQVAVMEVPVGQGWWQRLRQSHFVRFSVFFALVQFSVAIASPFFTVYMLRDLEFSYVMFMCNSGMAVLAQFLTLNRWGRISDIFGNRRVLAATGIMIPLMPLLWVFSANFWYLLVVQVISGVAWAGFSLSASNFLYDLIARDKRATYLAIHNVLASLGVFAGAITGGYLGTILPTQISIFGHTYSWLSPLLGVFLISALVRALIVILLVPKIREVRNVRQISFKDLIFRVTRVNALAGIIFDVIGSKNKGP